MDVFAVIDFDHTTSLNTGVLSGVFFWGVSRITLISDVCDFFLHPKASDLPCFWKRLDLKYAGRETAAMHQSIEFADVPETAQGGPALFLPQLLHVLALHMKQAEREIFLEIRF